MASFSAPGASGPSEEFKKQLDALQALVKRTRDLVATQQQFEAQAHENSMVEEELNNVAEGPTACVYKLSARVLVRQDLADAKATVKSRLELIAKGAKDTEAAIKRAMAEQDDMRAKLQALQRDCPAGIHAVPLESDILQWHYVIEGPPASPYAGGFFHGLVRFPSEYPFKPPAVMIYTPSGRFATNTRICLSMSDFHP